MLSRSAMQAVRSFSTSTARAGGHGYGGYPQPGDNVPFQIKNKLHLLLTFTIFFGTAAAFPFWVMKRGYDRES